MKSTNPPIVVEFKQNTKEWYQWRNGGIGASEAAVVLGISPWSTRFELWAVKTGKLKKGEFNPFAVAAMKRGHDLEPVARELYEERVGFKVPPVSFMHGDHTFIRASLDGWNEERRHVAEIKCPGKADQTKARKGKVPDKYYVQLQQQMLVCGAESADYISYDGKDELIVIPVMPDPEYQRVLLNELIEFWELVETKTPPKVDATDLSKVCDTITKQLEAVNTTMEALYALNAAFTLNHFGGK